MEAIKLNSFRIYRVVKNKEVEPTATASNWEDWHENHEYILQYSGLEELNISWAVGQILANRLEFEQLIIEKE